ncbi:MAG: hypothetical protein H0X31_18755 [Nostocaceae cyanobacterium]|nr:hypothetical protein [Nostocaceae cyanobacterium]
MRIWNFWLNNLFLSTQQNPARIVELLMLVLALVMLGIRGVVPKWPYLVLGLSLVIGASLSMLVREAIAPTPGAQVSQVIAVLLLIFSIYGFADLIPLL